MQQTWIGFWHFDEGFRHFGEGWPSFRQIWWVGELIGDPGGELVNPLSSGPSKEEMTFKCSLSSRANNKEMTFKLSSGPSREEIFEMFNELGTQQRTDVQ